MYIYEYEKMFRFEEMYWWYMGLRLFIKNAIRDTGLDLRSSIVLDAGCGTGANLKLLKELGCKEAHGFDLSKEAVRFCHQRNFTNVIESDVNSTPYEDNTFDLILCTDVFECFEVDERRAYIELTRILRPGGVLIMNVACFQFLLSEHDKAVHSTRRYTKRSAQKAFGEGNFPIRMRYLFFFTFPMVAGYKIFKRNFSFRKRNINPPSDLKPLPGFLKWFLYSLVLIEARLYQWFNFPVGSSLMIEVKKVEIFQTMQRCSNSKHTLGSNSWKLGEVGSLPYKAYDYLRNGLNMGLSDYLHSFIHEKQTVNIIEPGSGIGFCSSLLNKRENVRTTTIMDIDPQALALARSKDASLEIVEGDLLEMPFSDNTFDLVFNSSTIEHVVDSKKAFLEMVRICKPGSFVFVGLPYKNGPLGLFCVLAKDGNVREWVGQFITRDVVLSWEEECQVELVDVRYYFNRFFQGFMFKKLI